MHSSLATWIAAAVLLASCGTSVPNGTKPLLDVPAAVANLNKLDGRTVRVTGFLSHCAGFECVLFANPDDARGFDQYIASLEKMERFREFGSPMLGIGGDKDFDRKAARYVPGFVAITGELTNECRGWDGQPRCSDRTTDIIPTGIEAWHPSPLRRDNPNPIKKKATLN